ncbi:amino acid adenylation domain-containing protein [Kibdelosporangium philippinense]|uniref:Phenyloxazoline synthase MbtB n=1 Tax=Kibdelosporangium philippinense TaxID=211113 RepID=A0ABS8ZN90_9PSEU|nr:non-ribosomal peptide synthetase [Kibdelosporangium philippinense]MCE7007287.1 amino acid adenylation domain-containing protein [Kibdelosporangium philippinense]
MNAKELVADLERIGIRLWAEGDELRFRAPRGSLTQEYRDLLRADKPAVLDYLRVRQDIAELVADPAARHEPFPLTGIQTAYLLGRSRAHDYGGVACHAYVELAFGPDADPARLAAAWQTLVHRHDMLRAVVSADGYQRVLETVAEYRIETVDVRTADSLTVDSAIDAARAALRDRVPETDTWPLFALRMTHTATALVLHLSVDLLVTDYASLQLLLAELEDVYDGAELAPLELTFRDYVLGQRGLVDSPHYDRDREYWLGRLPDLPPAPDLPVLSTPEEVGAFRRIETELSGSDFNALSETAARHGLTPSSVLLTAYAETVGRWSRTPRFTITVPTFARLPLHPGVGAVVGDFTNAELLAVDLADALPFADRVRALHGTLLEDLAHPLFSGSEVLAELSRRGARTLMPVVFTSTLGTPGRVPKATVLHAETQTPQVWLDCQVMARGDRLTLAWDVRDGVLADRTADDMFDAFVALVRRLATQPDTWSRPVELPLPGRTQSTRQRVNSTAAPIPHELLHEPVLTAARNTPDAVAVWSKSGTLTYAELVDRSYAVAQALRDNDVRPGELVAVLMDKGPDQIVAVLGALFAGAAYLPIDTTQPVLRRDTIRTDAAVRVTLTHSGLTERPTGVCLDVDTVRPATRPVVTAVAPDALAYVIYTSGSTGAPKGVMISHRAAANTVADINRRFAVSPADRVLALAQLGFDLSVYDIFGPLSVGAAVVLPDDAHRGDPQAWAGTIDRAGVTIWNSVPAQFELLHSHLAAIGRALNGLRLAMLSGDWIPLSLPDRIRAVCEGIEVHSLGGATEASIWSISHRVGRVDPAWRSIPYGTPLSNQSWHVLDSALRPCPDWATGELYIGGVGLAEGYLGDAARTAERFITHPGTGERLYRTGDLGRYRPDGVIEFLGRVDDQVKIRGHRIEPGEIEAALAVAPGVASGVVLVDGVTGPGTGASAPRLVAFVEPARRTAPLPVPPTVARAAERALTAATGDLDEHSLKSFVDAMDRAATLSIAGTVAAAVRGSEGLTSADIATALEVPPNHHRLLDRWLELLVTADLVRRDDEGRYHGFVEPDPETVAEAWDEAAELERAVHWSPVLFTAVRECARALPAVLRGTVEIDSVLFADQASAVLSAAYRDNLPVRVLHQALTAAVSAIADAHTATTPLRIMELGVRGGGAAAALVPELAEFSVDYLVTDSSPGMLAQARELFSDQPGSRFGLFDFDRDLREQGYAPNSVDVLVCAGTLNNAANAADTLRALTELLVPGGWLVLLENTADASAALQISTEFLDTHNQLFTDVRAATGQTFLRREQWVELLAAADARIVAELPGTDGVLAAGGQQLFLAQVKTDREPVRVSDLVEHVGTRLPAYMTPTWWQIVDSLPVTANGKIDRRTLASWVSTDHADTEAAEPLDALEARLAALWAGLLGLDQVGRTDDIFALGADSLLVARFVGQLRDGLDGVDGPAEWDLEWEMVLRHLLRHPTVAGLASYLRAERAATAADSTTRTPIVELAGGGDGPVTVLVHAGHGTMRPYSALLMDPRLRNPEAGTVVGLEISSVDAYLSADPAGLIPSIAHEYASALLDRGRRFNIIGYSVGGVIATEVARALTEAEAQVDSLIVISSHTPSFHLDDELLLEYSFALMMGMDLAKIGFSPDFAGVGRAAAAVLAKTPKVIADGAIADLGGEFADISETFLALESVPRMRRIARMCEALPAELAGSLDPEGMLRALRVYQQSTAALSRHEVEPYAGDITFLRHDGAYQFPGDRQAHTEHWERVCLGRLTVIDIPGDHFSCLSAENGDVVSAHIHLALSGAETTS